jgi:hypothetical protein
LGGDVYRRVTGKIVPTVDSWYANRRPGESFGEFAARSRTYTLEYLEHYPDPRDGTVIYALTFQEE